MFDRGSHPYPPHVPPPPPHLGPPPHVRLAELEPLVADLAARVQRIEEHLGLAATAGVVPARPVPAPEPDFLHQIVARLDQVVQRLEAQSRS